MTANLKKSNKKEPVLSCSESNIQLGFYHSNLKATNLFLFSSLLSVSLGCARPPGVQHGDLLNQTEANRGSFPPGTLLTYGCEPGYTADGPTSIICTSSGDWSPQPPSCIRSNGEQDTKNADATKNSRTKFDVKT